MKQLIISFDFHRKHRMPQYNFRSEFIPQEEEKEIWLRVPIKISSEYYSLSFFVQSIMDIKNFENEQRMWELTTQFFSELLSKQNSWNILDMQNLYLSSALEIHKSKENLFTTSEITINENLHNHFFEISKDILKVQEIINLSKKYLSYIIDSSGSYGFSFYEKKIKECIYFMNRCSSNISEHGEKIYFDKQLFYIEIGFRELIKRKRVSNDTYQRYLSSTSMAIYRLPIPKEWSGYIPVPNESLVDFLEEYNTEDS